MYLLWLIQPYQPGSAVFQELVNQLTYQSVRLKCSRFSILPWYIFKRVTDWNVYTKSKWDCHGELNPDFKSEFQRIPNWYVQSKEHAGLSGVKNWLENWIQVLLVCNHPGMFNHLCCNLQWVTKTIRPYPGSSIVSCATSQISKKQVCSCTESPLLISFLWTYPPFFIRELSTGLCDINARCLNPIMFLHVSFFYNALKRASIISRSPFEVTHAMCLKVQTFKTPVLLCWGYF